MKKLTYIVSAIAVILSAAACTAIEGTEPGNDSLPGVAIYQYAPGAGYNADNDVKILVAANSKADNVYYIAEKKADYDSHIAQGEQSYAQYIISSGTKLTVNPTGMGGTKEAEVYIKGLEGEYVITAVASAGSDTDLSSTSFTGLLYEDYKTGKYIFGNATIAKIMGGDTIEGVKLMKCTNKANIYLFKDLFGAGHSMKIETLPDYTGYDDGNYTFFRIPAQPTGLTYGNYGEIGVRDIGYWQGNSAWITDNGYESGIFDDGYCFIYAQWYVSAGSLGYKYDYFVPEN